MFFLLSSFVDVLTNLSKVSFILLCILVVAWIVWYKKTRLRQASLPPGPTVLPLVGNLLTMVSPDLYKTLSDLRKQYGDVYRLYIGKELMIVLNGYDVIQEAMVKNGSIFSDRPWCPFRQKIMDNPVLMAASGKVWKDTRSFSQQSLKKICLDNSALKLQEILTEEVEYFLKEMDERDNTELNIVKFVDIYSLNVVFRLVFGHRFTHDDSDGLYMTEVYNELGMEFAKLQVMANCFDFLLKLPCDLLNLNKFLKLRNKLDTFMRYFAELPNHNYDSSTSTFCDEYLEELDRNENSDIDDVRGFSSLNKHRLPNTCSELIGAASDTTANAIGWLIVYLVREPDIQMKMFEEIKQVLGTEEQPVLEDKTRLPYTEAVILESLRISSSVPYAIPHAVSKTIDFQGYTIPEGSTILVNLKSVLHDDVVFKNPEEFIPDRFMNATHTETVVPKEFVPFSLGPRSCLGISIAMKEMFLVIVALVQRYELLPSSSLPESTGILSTVYKPRPFTVRIKKRT
ncbi:hypothetical protein ACF0H5_016668 [Mactra antiquata]